MYCCCLWVLWIPEFPKFITVYLVLLANCEKCSTCTSEVKPEGQKHCSGFCVSVHGTEHCLHAWDFSARCCICVHFWRSWYCFSLHVVYIKVYYEYTQQTILPTYLFNSPKISYYSTISLLSFLISCLLWILLWLIYEYLIYYSFVLFLCVWKNL